MRNVTSAKDCGVLLENIYRGTCVSAKYSKAMLNLLLAQTRQWKIPASLPSGVKVANKTGETDTVENDIAIVYGPKADYVICIFSNVGNSSYAISKLQTISRTVYNYWN
jgi:beta-lactamase class A